MVTIREIKELLREEEPQTDRYYTRKKAHGEFHVNPIME